MGGEIKYTTDGKKVIIIGNLNQQEKIVQEIFIINEIEVPSGENFVVKSLHDAPAVSWKEDAIKKMEATYTKKDREYKDLGVRLRKQVSTTRKRIQCVLDADKNFDVKQLERLSRFISGDFTHYVESNYGSITILPIGEATCNYDGTELKLLTLWGSSKGNLNWKLGNYSDGSGGSSEVVPYVSYEEALEAAQNILDKRETINSYDIKSSEKYDLYIPKEKLLIYYQKELKNKESYIDEKEKSLTQGRNNLIKVQDKISSLEETK
jgi:hypothetical protein